MHNLDRLLMLPDSAADVLRYTADFGVFRRGLIETGLATIVNDTSTHLGQTLFVPSNAAFKKLGRKANKFLFGPGGREYLKALLGYHIVANQTMFSDVLFPLKMRFKPCSLGNTQYVQVLTLCSSVNLPIISAHSLRLFGTTSLLHPRSSILVAGPLPSMMTSTSPGQISL